MCTWVWNKGGQLGDRGCQGRALTWVGTQDVAIVVATGRGRGGVGAADGGNHMAVVPTRDVAIVVATGRGAWRKERGRGGVGAADGGNHTVAVQRGHRVVDRQDRGSGSGRIR